MAQPGLTMAATDRIRARIARHGWRGTLAKALGDHVFRISSSVILEGDDDRLRRRASIGMTRDYRMVVLRDGDAVPALCPFLAHRAADFAAMLHAGKVGVFLIRDDVAVGCVWLALRDHHDVAARERYRVGPDEAYQYCWLLDPEERTRGGGMILVRMVLDACRALGIQRYFAVVDRDNRASYRILQHMGFRERGVLVRHLYILHSRWTWTSRYAGTLGLSARAA